MKPETVHRSLALTALALLLAAVVALPPLLAPAPPADACSPTFPVPAFWPDGSTGVAWEEMVGGELGILVPGVAARELYVAYRHLAGPPLSAADRELLAAFDAPQPYRRWWPEARPWVEARRRLTAVQPMPDRHYFDVSRVERIELPDGGVMHRYLLNCLSDAFETAEETLLARIATYGAGSPEVAEWVRGQDQVFANCDDGRTIPEPLDDSWPEALRHDREYQIAAAHFYVLDYAEAERRFRAIGEEERSAWRHLARYLVARTQARDLRWAEAVETLRGLADDPAQAERRESILGLIDHYRTRSAPAELHADKRRALLASPLPESAKQDWIDYRATFHGAGGDADLDRWIAAFARPERRRETVAATDALAAWREEPSSRHWLVAALAAAEPGGDDRLDDLLAAATVVGEAAPEATTVAYHRARLLLALGRDGEATELLDRLLADSEALPLTARNRVQALRAEHAESLEAYLRWSQMEPSGLTADDDYWTPWDGEPLAVTLSDEAVRLLNHLAAGELAAVAEGEVLVEGVRRRVARAAWTRAVLLGDAPAAERLAPLVARLTPSLASAMDDYLAADAGERRFVAVLTLLRQPGLHPELQADLPPGPAQDELDAYRRNWWCPAPVVDRSEPFAPPPFFAADAHAAELRAQTYQALSELPSGPVLLGDLAINWADRHRDDPRVPEALHRVVRATRYGCSWGEDLGAVSKDAFDRLHRRYPDSEWTKKTPYWFD